MDETLVQQSANDTGTNVSVLTVISDRLKEIRDDVKDLRRDVNDRFDKLNEEFVSKDVFTEIMKAFDSRIQSLEDDRKKLITAVVTAVGMAILSLVLGGVDLSNLKGH